MVSLGMLRYTSVEQRSSRGEAWRCCRRSGHGATLAFLMITQHEGAPPAAITQVPPPCADPPT